MSEEASSSPRRSTRVATKSTAQPDVVAEPSTAPLTGKSKHDSEKVASRLEFTLTSTRSRLVKCDISEVINYSNFLDLSQEAQERLVKLLPETAFQGFHPTISPDHADYPILRNKSIADNHDAMENDYAPGPSNSPSSIERSQATLDPLAFISPFFLSAARTFQDHLYSGWLTQKSLDKVATFQEGIRAGSMHADWKDEAWARDHPRHSQSRQIDLTHLAKHGLLRDGDILAYRRDFPDLRVVITKDLLIEGISPRSHTLVVLLAPDTVQSLQPEMLIAGGSEQRTTGKMLQMENIDDPLELESGILDVDGRLSRADRIAAGQTGPPQTADERGPNEQASGTSRAVKTWKSFTVWRWRGELRDSVDVQLIQDRGGREKIGTLYYLRAYAPRE